MLEVRYIKETGEPTGWCGDSKQFGNLDRGDPDEAIVILDIPVPPLSCGAYLIQNPDTVPELISNPDYVEPLPPRDLAAEVDTLKAKVAELD